MALSYKCDLFCDRCQDWIDGGETQHGNITGMGRTARNIGKNEGWKRLKAQDGTIEDVCPECQEKEK